MWRHALLSILVLIGAAGCSPQGQRTIPVAPPETTTAKPVAPEPPPPPQAAVPLPEHKPDDATNTAAPVVDPKQLVGLTFDQTQSLLGQPAKKEEKPPAEVWTYDNEGCELDIFFYADIKTREFHALTYEVKDAQSTGGSNEQCLARWTRGT